MNQQYLETAAAQGWLTQEHIDAVVAALGENPDLSLSEFFLSQGWLSSEQTAWIDQQLGLTSVDQVIPTETQSAPAVESSPHTGQSESRADEGSVEMSIGDDGAFASVEDYLKIAKEQGASDVHIGVSATPIMRLHGTLRPLWPEAPLLEEIQTKRLLMAILNTEQRATFDKNGDVDFCYSSPNGLGRFRTSIVRQRLGIDGVFRIIDNKVRTMDDLGLPANLKGLTKFHNGLVLVTGPAGSGKSTTLAAMVEEVNASRHDHIITLEDPIEYVFDPKGCQVSQREVHTHTQSFAAALRGALREDPDVIMVGEMRDLETISLAITAAETGHLVFGTLHTSSASRTLDRLLDAFPIDQQAQIRTMVAGSLRGIVSQQLVPRIDGQGRVLALEILMNIPSAAAIIRDGKTFMLNGVMQTGKKAGCRLMDDSLMNLMVDGIITAQEAYDRADQKALFKEYLTE